MGCLCVCKVTGRTVKPFIIVATTEFRIHNAVLIKSVVLIGSTDLEIIS